MATIAPLRALRYAPNVNLSACIAPPYDVIGADLQRRLLAEPHNIVHIDYGPGSTNPAEPGNRYDAAHKLLGEWMADGILEQDQQPALYVYEQDYEWAGQTYTRRSMVARVRLEPLATGHIHPHEQTFSGPKEDRYQLTRATKVMLSQHLGIYPDPENEVMDLLAAQTGGAPDVEATGVDGVRNRLWVVSDPRVIQDVVEAMADRDIFIADGHHRYEMMLRYQQSLAESGELTDDHPANFTVFVLTGSGDAGLCVMPTHRIASGWPAANREAVLAALGDDFEVSELSVDPTHGDALDSALAASPLHAVGLLFADRVLLATPRDPAWLDHQLAALTPALRELNVSVLHRLVLPRLEAALGQPQLSYVHRADEAVAAIADGSDLAFLLRSAPLASVLDVALAHELMPHKSTYFYPKVATGLVMYRLT